MKKTLPALILTLHAFIWASDPAAASNWLNGNQLQRECQKKPPWMALGFVFGVVDALDVSAQESGLRFYCVPKGVQGGQMVDVVCQYVDSNPDQRHVPASYLTIAALKDAWPCE